MAGKDNVAAGISILAYLCLLSSRLLLGRVAGPTVGVEIIIVKHNAYTLALLPTEPHLRVAGICTKRDIMLLCACGACVHVRVSRPLVFDGVCAGPDVGGVYGRHRGRTHEGWLVRLVVAYNVVDARLKKGARRSAHVHTHTVIT